MKVGSLIRYVALNKISCGGGVFGLFGVFV